MIITLEGAPGSGKTWLAESFLAGGAALYRYDRPDSAQKLIEAEIAVRNQVELFRRVEVGDLVLDRHPTITQPIFAPYTFEAPIYYNIDTDYLILCDPGIEEIMKNRAGTRFAPHLKEIREAYLDTAIEIAKTKPIGILLYDYTKHIAKIENGRVRICER